MNRNLASLPLALLLTIAAARPASGGETIIHPDDGYPLTELGDLIPREGASGNNVTVNPGGEMPRAVMGGELRVESGDAEAVENTVTIIEAAVNGVAGGRAVVYGDGTAVALSNILILEDAQVFLYIPPCLSLRPIRWTFKDFIAWNHSGLYGIN